MFSAAACRCGTDQIERFLEHRSCEDLYLSAAVQFLSGLQGPQLDLLPTRAVIASGSGLYEDVPAARRTGERSAQRRAGPRRHLGPRVPHDWVTWQRMVPQYLTELC